MNNEMFNFPDYNTVEALAQAYKNVRIGTVFDASTGLFNTGNVPLIMEKINKDPGYLVFPLAPSADKLTIGASYQSMSMVYNYMDVSAQASGQGTIPISIPVSARAGAGMYFQNMQKTVDAQKTVSVNCIALVKPDWLKINRDNAGNLVISPNENRLSALAQYVTPNMKEDLKKFGLADTEGNMAEAYANFKRKYGTHVVTGVKLLAYASANLSYEWKSLHEEQQLKHGENVDIAAGIPLLSGGGSVATNFLKASTKETVRYSFKVSEKYFPVNGPLADSVREFAKSALNKAMDKIEAGAVDAGPANLPRPETPKINAVDKEVLNNDEKAALNKFRENKLKDALEQGEFKAWKTQNGLPDTTPIDEYRRWKQARLDALRETLNNANPANIPSAQLFTEKAEDPFCLFRSPDEEDLKYYYEDEYTHAPKEDWLGTYIISEVELTSWQEILGLSPKYLLNPITEAVTKLELRAQQFNVLIQYFGYCKRYSSQTHIASFESGIKNITDDYKHWIELIFQALGNRVVTEADINEVGNKFPDEYLKVPGKYSSQFRDCFQYAINNFKYIYKAPFGYAFKREGTNLYYCDVQAQSNPFRDIGHNSLSDLLFKNKDNTKGKPQERLMRWYPIIAYSNTQKKPCFIFVSYLFETHPDNAYSDDAHDFDLEERTVVAIYGKELHSHGWWPSFDRFTASWLNEGIASFTWNPLKQHIIFGMHRWHKKYQTFMTEPSYFDTDYLDGYAFDDEKYLRNLHNNDYFYATPENGLWFGVPNRKGSRIELVPFDYTLVNLRPGNTADQGVVGGALFSKSSLEIIINNAKKYLNAA